MILIVLNPALLTAAPARELSSKLSRRRAEFRNQLRTPGLMRVCDTEETQSTGLQTAEDMAVLGITQRNHDDGPLYKTYRSLPVG